LPLPSSSVAAALLLPPSLLSALASGSTLALASASGLLSVITAQSFTKETTPKKKKVNHANSPPGLLAKLSHLNIMGDFED
jgi:hypothetical protein